MPAIPMSISYKKNDNKYTEVWVSGTLGRPFTGWKDEAYRTIILDEPATGDLLTWLKNNAVKQEK